MEEINFNIVTVKRQDVAYVRAVTQYEGPTGRELYKGLEASSYLIRETTGLSKTEVDEYVSSLLEDAAQRLEKEGFYVQRDLYDVLFLKRNCPSLYTAYEQKINANGVP